ncbi:DNA repair/transcription protein met18/mms19 [Anaeramoeba flamelloides]|uniref:MMS19 nucleotide excision repair protein n=1 Tax=Anaeramoeba flamelloides TaxID=1746091 RepID=A0ABQ8XH95_9EUKA|nr:DNA repair/transcription protein met18/mms19 [Anaeramoeba flamelloides]
MEIYWELIEQFCQTHSKKKNKKRLVEIILQTHNQNVPFFEVQKKLKEQLGSIEDDVRYRALWLLSELLIKIEKLNLANESVSEVVVFFENRLSDVDNLSPIILALRSLFIRYKIEKSLIARVTKAIITDVHIQSLRHETRLAVYHLIQITLVECQMSLRNYSGEFLIGFINAMEGETDPRCLSVCFSLFPPITNLCKSDAKKVARRLVKMVTVYFPIKFQAPKGVQIDITEESLTMGLDDCFTSLDCFAPYVFPFLAEKMTNPLPFTKKSSFRITKKCVDKYSRESIMKAARGIWETLQYEIQIAVNEDEKEGRAIALQVVESIIKKIGDKEIINWCKENVIHRFTRGIFEQGIRINRAENIIRMINIFINSSNITLGYFLLTFFEKSLTPIENIYQKKGNNNNDDDDDDMLSIYQVDDQNRLYLKIMTILINSVIKNGKKGNKEDDELFQILEKYFLRIYNLSLNILNECNQIANERIKKQLKINKIIKYNLTILSSLIRTDLISNEQINYILELFSNILLNNDLNINKKIENNLLLEIVEICNHNEILNKLIINGLITILSNKIFYKSTNDNDNDNDNDHNKNINFNEELWDIMSKLSNSFAIFKFWIKKIIEHFLFNFNMDLAAIKNENSLKLLKKMMGLVQKKIINDQKEQLLWFLKNCFLGLFTDILNLLQKSNKENNQNFGENIMKKINGIIGYFNEIFKSVIKVIPFDEQKNLFTFLTSQLLSNENEESQQIIKQKFSIFLIFLFDLTFFLPHDFLFKDNEFPKIMKTLLNSSLNSANGVERQSACKTVSNIFYYSNIKSLNPNDIISDSENEILGILKQDNEKIENVQILKKTENAIILASFIIKSKVLSGEIESATQLWNLIFEKITKDFETKKPLFEKYLLINCSKIIYQPIKDSQLLNNKNQKMIDKLFTSIYGKLQKTINAQQEQKSDLHNIFLVSLCFGINNISKALLIKNFKILFPNLLQILKLSSKIDFNNLSNDPIEIQYITQLNFACTSIFSRLIQDSDKQLIENTGKIIKSLLLNTTFAYSMEIRIISLKALTTLLCTFPKETSFEFKKLVLDSLNNPLTDKKRLVRIQARRCRNSWFMLEI